MREASCSGFIGTIIVKHKAPLDVKVAVKQYLTDCQQSSYKVDYDITVQSLLFGLTMFEVFGLFRFLYLHFKRENGANKHIFRRIIQQLFQNTNNFIRIV